MGSWGIPFAAGWDALNPFYEEFSKLISISFGGMMVFLEFLVHFTFL